MLVLGTGPRPTGTFAKRLNFAQPGQLNVCASEALAGIPRVGAAAVGLEVSDVERVAAAELRAQSIEGRLPITLEQLEVSAKHPPNRHFPNSVGPDLIVMMTAFSSQGAALSLKPVTIFCRSLIGMRSKRHRISVR